MFSKKHTQLFEVPKKEGSIKDPFLRAATKTDTIFSEEGAIKLRSTGSDFVDQFASASKYKEPRSFEDISIDMAALWAVDPILTIKFTFYLRTITRKVKYHNGDSTPEVQIGQGLKHESIMRFIWIAVNHPEEFSKILSFIPIVGSWKDLIQMMQYDAMYNHPNYKLNWREIIAFIGAGLLQAATSSLVKKYLPTIRPKKKCRTIEAQADNLVAKAIVGELFGRAETPEIKASLYRQYRKTKRSGTAHTWQQLISQRRFEDLEFDKIAGRALALLTNSKFLENQDLIEKFEKWAEKQPIAKYTGYVYELFAPYIDGLWSEVLVNIPRYKQLILNAQFNQLVEQARKDMSKDDKGFICVLDTSGSMSGKAKGASISAYTVAKTMTLFFSELLGGRFQNSYFEFSESTIYKKFKGSTPFEKYRSDQSRITASTNFYSVADKLVEIRQQGVDEKDFPSGMLVLSDGEFHSSYRSLGTEVESFRRTLRNGGFSKEFVEDFKIIFWDIPNGWYESSEVKFEAVADEPNTYHIGGLDGSVISFLMGREHQKSTPKSSEELFAAAMDQRILNEVAASLL